MKVCSEVGAHATHCLDSCNGYAALLPGVDEFRYRYYMTGPLSDLTSEPLSPLPDESFFPFTPMCLRGCCPDSVVGCPGLLPRCSGAAEAGTTGAYAPSELEGVVTVPGAPTAAPTPAPTTAAADMGKLGVSQGCNPLMGLMAGTEAEWTCANLPKDCCGSFEACNGR